MTNKGPVTKLSSLTLALITSALGRTGALVLGAAS
jgi:hypothetical protein